MRLAKLRIAITVTSKAKESVLFVWELGLGLDRVRVRFRVFKGSPRQKVHSPVPKTTDTWVKLYPFRRPQGPG